MENFIFCALYVLEAILTLGCDISRQTIHDSRSNNTPFMHKLCFALHVMNRLAPRETAYIALKTSLDN